MFNVNEIRAGLVIIIRSKEAGNFNEGETWQVEAVHGENVFMHGLNVQAFGNMTLFSFRQAVREGHMQVVKRDPVLETLDIIGD